LSLGEILSVLVALAGMKIAWDTIQRQREMDELRLMVKESQLSFLNSQINPHFLFNNLNNLYSYAVEQSPKTPEIILGLSGVLRYMLYECRESTVPLTMEIDHLHNFIQLYELQIEGRGSVEFNTENIEEGYQISPLILSVFVENAFKHTQSGQSDQIKIAVSVTVNNDGELNFICQNNFHPGDFSLNEKNGIGLENVKKRLNLLYPDQHELVIDQTKEDFFVNLTIKLNKA
jgi:LytS/YehU family sensor histidine kinase